MVGGFALHGYQIMASAVRDILGSHISNVVLLPFTLWNNTYEGGPAVQYKDGMVRREQREGLVTRGELTSDVNTGKTAFRVTNYFTHKTDILYDDNGDGTLDRIVLGIEGGEDILEQPQNGTPLTRQDLLNGNPQYHLKPDPQEYERRQQEFTEALRRYDLSHPEQFNGWFKGLFDE